MATSQPFQTRPSSTSTASGWATLWLVALFPLLIASVLSALKVGELASTIVGGGGGGGSGALGLAGAAAGASGGGRLAATAVKGGAGGV